jgi:hypothetical protein
LKPNCGRPICEACSRTVHGALGELAVAVISSTKQRLCGESDTSGRPLPVVGGGRSDSRRAATPTLGLCGGVGRRVRHWTHLSRTDGTAGHEMLWIEDVTFFPGKLNMASAGNGIGSHLYGELFKMLTGVNLVHIPYRGAPPALTDLMSGQVQVMFPDMPSSIEYIKAGKLHALGITAATRDETLPEIPTIGEFVPGYEASGWFGTAPEPPFRGLGINIYKVAGERGSRLRSLRHPALILSKTRLVVLCISRHRQANQGGYSCKNRYCDFYNDSPLGLRQNPA